MNYILGLNSVYHDSSACLVGHGNILAYAEEERLNRVKHAKFSLPDNADVLPFRAIDHCLHVGGIRGSDITHVGFSFVPEKRLRNLGVDSYPISGAGYGSDRGERLLQEKVQTIPDQIRQYLGNPHLVFTWLDHHLCHAVSAVHVSPYTESAFFIVDGIAEFETISLGHARGNAFTITRTIDYPNSIGFLWEKISIFLGFTKYDAGKIMGLGSYGQSQHTYRQFREFIEIGEGTFRINNDILRIRSDDMSELEKIFGMPRRDRSDPIREKHADVVAGLQHITEDVILHLAEDLAHTTHTDNLCLAGGVALNCKANTRLAEARYFTNIFIPPHCNDAGTSIGAALFLSSQQGNSRPSPNRPFIPYWPGTTPTDATLAALSQSPYRYRKVDTINQTAAELLSEGAILAYYHGTSEIGPRALGNRSIFAAANDFMIKERLNFHFKQREFFRPLAPMVLREHLEEYFEMTINFTPSLYYMLFVLKVRPEKQALVPGVTHIDGTARLQVVDAHVNPNLYDLMQRYYALTGVPILLNTSFNRQEPIVHTPEEALDTFGKIPRLLYLVLNDFLVQKESEPRLWENQG